MSTGFYWAERCFWHSGGNYAGNAPVGGLVQPLAAGGLPENPEGKRRLKNLADVTGLSRDLVQATAPPATWDALARVHDTGYLERFRAMAEAGGGEIGLRAPFGVDGFEIAALSAGLATGALRAVLTGEHANAYALSRPPGHHCTRDFPNGFCLVNNIAVALETARAEGRLTRAAVLDWDVHHGNGTEAIYYDDPDTLTVSLHQERNYPLDTGGFEDRGTGAGAGANLNIPLPPGAGHVTWLAALERLALPAIRAFRPEVIVVACGYDAALIDPLSRMMCTADTYRRMTRATRTLAGEVCDGRLLMVHEGGYSEVYVPFCGHAVLEELSDSAVRAPDPFADAYAARQPSARFDAFAAGLIDEMAAALAP
ncbi:deacetylase / probable acetylpolyamine aminohydrolase [Oceanicola granulosus HTCC2516]|uniref:Deacetylase / probable acetylpolyamine aminohydrolase n=1 Tax=Oceanicola granulosus (strain ATCC BAA-861 / DSM 15982 / KCTC 12143 / HTCC2516) TaxID=314256 RepID=Q2CFJ7_OCEGH|nr:class II histone deacetylase [Oceanicola granulosus]EAR51485.1 deacetylase / probable acetylpolyamine aminohydrolase [Oceanicola granulosus HTCC2516]